MKRLYGRPAVPITHKDFTLEVPCWHYILECGHTARYVLRVPWGEYGWCSNCREPWVYDWNVTEVHPESGKRPSDRQRLEALPQAGTLEPDETAPVPRKRKRRKINPVELSVIQDQATIRNRIADMLWAFEADSLTHAEADFLAGQTNSSRRLVYIVADEMGIHLGEADPPKDDSGYSLWRDLDSWRPATAEDRAR